LWLSYIPRWNANHIDDCQLSHVIRLPEICVEDFFVLTTLPSSGYQGPSSEVKRSGREADHSSPYSAEVKNAWTYNSTPQYVFMAWCLGTGTTLPFILMRNVTPPTALSLLRYTSA
jgi:hypothetical protein